VEVPLDEFKKKCTNVTATDALKCVRKGKVTIKRAFCSQGGIDESSFYKVRRRSCYVSHATRPR